MIRVKCFGGLGNQLFQYATARAVQEKYGGELYIDISNFETDKRKYSLDNYKLNKNIKIIKEDKSFTNLNYNIFLKILCKIMPKFAFEICSIFGKYLYLGKQYVEIKQNFTNNYYLYGYWQSEKFFKDIKQIIKEELKLKDTIKKSHQNIIEDMERNNSVAIHIRRGDYVGHKLYENICDEEYYKNAIEIINKNVENPIFYVFSDEIEWVKNNWKFNDNIKYIEEKNKDYEEINLMSHCKHYIIANSTFSWWGQYLCDNPNKIVVAPKKWYNNKNKVDIYMKDWIII